MPVLTLFDGQPDAVTKGERDVTKRICLMISELPCSSAPERRGCRRCDNYPALDIRHPHHRELIDEPGSCVSWRWNRNGQPLCYIDIVFHRDHVMLTDVTDRTRPLTLSVSLLRT